MKIGGRIKELRLLNNLTQKELANKLGLTPKMISFYENSERTPPIDIILKLVSIFDVSSDYLLGLTDSYYNNVQEDKSGTSLTDLPDGATLLLNTYKELSPPNQRTLLHSAFSLLEEQSFSKEATLKKSREI